MNDELVAFIAEGNTEQAIIDVLLDHDALRCTRENVLQEVIVQIKIISTIIIIGLLYATH